LVYSFCALTSTNLLKSDLPILRLKMKRKCEHRELTGAEAKVRRITRSVSRKKVQKTGTIYTGRELCSSRIDITDLPPEMMLQIFSWLSVRDRCQCVAPLCKKWSILARHPFLWKELSFGKDISKSNVLFADRDFKYLNHPPAGVFKPTTLTCALFNLKINIKSPN
jgi:hypothetical protein